MKHCTDSPSKRSLGRRVLVSAVLLAAGAGLLAAGCPRKPSPSGGAGKNKGTKSAKEVEPPKSPPDCEGACRYFVHCQSARWTPEEEQKTLEARCNQDCKSVGPDSQESIFFKGIKECAVGKDCVAFGTCVREVIGKLRQAMEGGAPQEDPDAIYRVPVGHSPVLGKADAPVTIVVFADYECPFCGRGWKTVTSLQDKHRGEIRIVYKHYPLPSHEQAKVAARAAECVKKQKGEAAFWKVHEALFDAQDLSEPNLMALAKAAGADPAQVTRCMKDAASQEPIAKDLQLGSSLGIQGTPAFFVNGSKITGAQPMESFEKAFGQALARAKSLMDAKGVKPAEVYEHLIKEGATAPVYLKGKGPRSEAPSQEPPELDPKVVYRVPVSRNDPARGPADALVTLVEFGDFQCPASGLASERMKRLAGDFPKDVRIVYRHFPLPSHQDATLAAEAALAVRAQKGDQGFWAYHDKLYGAQRDLSRPALEKLAQELGIDLERFKKDLDEHTFRPQVQRDEAFARKMGLTGTPAFYVNGKVMMGVPRSYDVLKARIQKEIEAAKGRLGGGVTRSTLYATLIQEGKTEPVFEASSPREGGSAAPTPPAARAEPAVRAEPSPR